MIYLTSTWLRQLKNQLACPAPAQQNRPIQEVVSVGRQFIDGPELGLDFA